VHGDRLSKARDGHAWHVMSVGPVREVAYHSAEAVAAALKVVACDGLPVAFLLRAKHDGFHQTIALLAGA